MQETPSAIKENYTRKLNVQPRKITPGNLSYNQGTLYQEMPSITKKIYTRKP